MSVYLAAEGGVSALEAVIGVLILVGWFAVLILIAKWAGRKGHSAVLNFFVGFLLSPILQLIIAALFSDRRKRAR